MASPNIWSKCLILMLLVANFANTKWCKNAENDWNPGKWVLIGEYSVRAIHWTLSCQGLDGFQFLFLHLCALDESSLSIGSVNTWANLPPIRRHRRFSCFLRPASLWAAWSSWPWLRRLSPCYQSGSPERLATAYSPPMTAWPWKYQKQHLQDRLGMFLVECTWLLRHTLCRDRNPSHRVTRSLSVKAPYNNNNNNWYLI